MESASLEFLQMLNSRRAAIKFIIEKETNSKSLTFLHVQIELTDKGYDMCVWREPVNTGLLLNYKANCLKTWKSGLIMCFLHCAKNICSTCELYLQELNKLLVIFQMNGYPNLFINDTIEKFEELEANTKEEEKCKKYFLFTIGLPYFGKISHKFSKRLKVLIKNKFNVKIDVYYTTLKTGLYFHLKCSTLKHLISNVVYKFTCSCDTNITYIGMTTIHLGVRVEEHLHSKKDSAVQKHINVC